MNPEQRLLIIHKYLPVEGLILLLRALIGMLVPKRIYIINRYWPFQNLIFFLCRRYFHDFFFAVFILLLLCLGLFHNSLYNGILLCQLILLDRLILRLCLCIVQKNRHRHKAAVLFQNFSCPVFIGKLHAVFIQIQSNGGSEIFSFPVSHLELRTAFRFPVYSLCVLLIG